jgi:hypothetical protein
MKHKEFLALRDHWYQLIQAAGHDDIEYADGSLRGQPTPPQSERSEYFRAIRELINSPGFTRRYCPRDQWRLEMHADGATWAEIMQRIRGDRTALARLLRRVMEEIRRG